MNDILIIRLSSLGDIIHTLPAFAALRKYCRGKISWAVEDKGREILECVPGIDEIINLPSRKSRWWSYLSGRKTSSLRQKNRTALDFQGLLKSGLIAFFSRAERRLGFNRKDLREPAAAVFYTVHLPPIQEEMHVIKKNLKLLSLVGINKEELIFPLEIPSAARLSLREKINEIISLDNSCIILINIGAAWESKKWFTSSWIKYIEMISDIPGIKPLILWGSDSEKKQAQAISDKTGAAMVPFLTLKEVLALIEKAHLIVSGDSFALQAAGALNKPVVALFGPTNPLRNGPFHKNSRVAFHKLPCSNCYQRSCSHLNCLKKITPGEVFSFTLELLKNNG